MMLMDNHRRFPALSHEIVDRTGAPLSLDHTLTLEGRLDFVHGAAIAPLVFPFIAGEGPGDRLARILEEIAAKSPSISKHPEVLIALAACVEDRPNIEFGRTTNCATSMRWIFAEGGCPHPFIHMPDEQIRAQHPEGPVAWVLEAAREMGALLPATEIVKNDDGTVTTIEHWRKLTRGWPIHYCTPGSNNDHMEWCRSPLDDKGFALHGGGGRGDNAITCSSVAEYILKSWGRPIAHIIDPFKMGLPVIGENAPDFSGDTDLEPAAAAA